MMSFEDHQDLSVFLARAESERPGKTFFQFLKKQEQLDAENFRVQPFAVDMGEEYAVVMGGHAMQRGKKRIKSVNPDALFGQVFKALHDPCVQQAIFEHPVGFEDGKVVPFAEDGRNSIVVIDDVQGITFCFEAGYSYVLVKTIWDHWTGRDFRTNSGTNCIVHI